jgi:hypothetical protein
MLRPLHWQVMDKGTGHRLGDVRFEEDNVTIIHYFFYPDMMKMLMKEEEEEEEEI